MKEPCIAIDVSKGYSHMQGFRAFEDAIGKAFKISHDNFGFERIKVLYEKLRQLTGTEPIIIFEATGVYDGVIHRFITINNYACIKMNPLKASHARKQETRAVKTDTRDCSSIARAYYTMHFEVCKKATYVYESLKQMNRYYVTELDHLRKCKVHVHEVLEIVYPGYERVFSNIFSDAGLGILEKYKHLEALSKATEKNIAKTIEKCSSHQKNGQRKKHKH